MSVKLPTRLECISKMQVLRTTNRCYTRPPTSKTFKYLANCEIPDRKKKRKKHTENNNNKKTLLTEIG